MNLESLARLGKEANFDVAVFRTCDGKIRGNNCRLQIFEH